MDTRGEKPRVRQARWLWLAGWCVVLTGLLLHATIRDRFDALAVVFYALPLPVLGAVALVLSAWPRWRKGALIFAVSIFAVWLPRSWCSTAPQPATAGAREFSALYWNLHRPKIPAADLIDLVRRLQPDVVGCGEPGPNFMQHDAAYEAALPGYTCEMMPRGLMVLSRWPLRMRGRGRLDETGAYASFDVSAPHGVVRLVLVDVWADPLRPRRRSLEETLAHAGDDARCILMGDFNTPMESVWFAPYHARFQDAFTAGGRGLRETWFWGVPLLSLDHIWAGKAWRVLETQKMNRASSDHAAIFVRLEQR